MENFLLCVLCVSVVSRLDGIGRAPFEDGASVMGRFAGLADLSAVIDEDVGKAAPSLLGEQFFQIFLNLVRILVFSKTKSG